MILFAHFENGGFHNVVWKLMNVAKLDVENKNVILTLSNVVHINVETHVIELISLNAVYSDFEIKNVVSTLI